jgi:heat shock protein HtpX
MYSQIASNKRRSIGLLLAFFLIVSALGWIFSRAFGSNGIFVFMVAFAIVYGFISYFASARITLALAGARPIQKSDAPELYRVVENLSIAAGLPMPKVYIVDDPSPNAFATGRNPERAIVAVHSGILPLLDKEELEGVLAHELSHVGNYDIRFMSIVVVLVSIIAVLSDLFLRASWFMGDDEERQGNQLFLIMGIVGAVLAPIAASLVQLAISRRREYLADASGALLTRYPEGLARALEKISQGPAPERQVSSAVAPLYISSPFAGREGLLGSVAKLFDTHPPIADRVAKLRQMEAQP